MDFNETWRDDLVVTAGFPERWAAVRRDVAKGILVPVIRGVYLPSSVNAARSRDAAHRDLAYAHELLAPGAHVFSRATAAALWRLPRIGAWPALAHVVSIPASGGRSEGRLRRHAVGTGEVDVVDGLNVTGLRRTVIDVARFDGFLNGVLAADRALAGISNPGGLRLAVDADELARELALSPRGRGVAIARQVIAFADGRSDSAGETLSRVRMRELGVPAPDLQFVVRDGDGEMRTDFCWSSRRIVGEFDGVAKYIREEFAAGLTPAEVVIAEKRREDRLRRLGWHVIRWGWDEALAVSGLRAVLSSAGLL